jgi:4'-phosphopantetheinyl transferase
MVIDKSQIHLWFHPIFISSEKLDSALNTLTVAERETYNEFPISSPRKIEYLVTRFLVRSVLSKYLHTPPQMIEFTKGEFGRPEISLPPTDLVFNISHCRDFVVCAIGSNCELGVDLEKTRDLSEIESIIQNHLTPQEKEVIQSFANKDQVEKFYELWTLKEAFIKAKGHGHSLRINRITFSVKDDSIQLSTPPDIEPHPEKWGFTSLRPANGYQLALAFRTQHGSDISIMTKTLFS